MAGIDIGIVVAFIVYSIYAGLKNRKIASENLEEYFLAGRSLSGWRAGISMSATQFAADTPLLVTGLIATAGIFSLWRLWIYALAFLLLGFLLAPSWRKARVLTDAELTELRYGSKAAGALRAVKAVYFGTLFNCTVLSMVLLASTRIAEPFLLWNEWLPQGVFFPLMHLVEWLGVPLTVAPLSDPQVWVLTANNLISIGAIVLVTTFYSTTGGLRSVVMTDIIQFGLAMTATAIFAWIVVSKAGGFVGIREALFARFPGPFGISGTEILAFTPSMAKDVSLAMLSVLGLQWLVQMNADGTGYLAQRTMACRSDKDARLASVVFTFAQVFVRSLLWIPLGLGLLVLFPLDGSLTGQELVAAREFSYVRGMADLLPVGVKGLMLAGMLAALASTLDTHLNWGASYWTNDIFKRFVFGAWLKREPSQRALVWIARGSNLLTFLIALAILPALSSIQKAWQISLLLGAGMGVLLVLRWVWWRINAWGELSCILFSLFWAPLLLWWFPDAEALRLLLMAFGATAAGVVVSLLTPVNKERLKEFYSRAHPPGFWGAIAQEVDGSREPSRRRFWTGIRTTLLAAFSLFCLLTGVGSWMVGSPPPLWFPWQGAWIALLLVLGAGLIPLWIRQVFQEG